MSISIFLTWMLTLPIPVLEVSIIGCFLIIILFLLIVTFSPKATKRIIWVIDNIHRAFYGSYQQDMKLRKQISKKRKRN